MTADISKRIRGRVLDMCHRARTPHLGSSLSCVDILTACYWGVLKIDPRRPDDPNRDRFIFSKGHAAMALYAALAERGFFSKDLLDTYNQDGGLLAEHPPAHGLPGVEVATGSLGHGLPVGIGMALASRIQRRPYRVFVLMSDGECNEGSVWEAAQFAPAHHLSHLAVIVDFNRWQATGRSTEVMALESLQDKWASFGWDARETDGHDVSRLAGILEKVPVNGKPLALIAHTVKGKGVSFMEDNNDWHYRSPTIEEVVAAKRELDLL